MKDTPDFRERALGIVQGSFDGWVRTKPRGDAEKYLINLGDFLIVDFSQALEEAYKMGFEAGIDRAITVVNRAEFKTSKIGTCVIEVLETLRALKQKDNKGDL